jgi:hypothetical protein
VLRPKARPDNGAGFFMVVFKPLHARKSCRRALAREEAGVSGARPSFHRTFSRASAILKPGVGPTNAHHEFIDGVVLILKLI